MTVQEMIDQLTKLVEERPEVKKYNVSVESCSCCDDLNYIETEVKDKELYLVTECK